MMANTRYKQTEIGVIPEDWEVVRIKNIAMTVRGGSPRPAGSPLYFNGTFIPWLTVASLTNISASKIFVNATETSLTELGSLYSRKLNRNTLIISNSGATLGVAKILNIDCCANDGIAALLNLTADSKYIVYYINSITDILRTQIATGNGQPNLNTELIGNLQIPLPPLPEQTAIAAALSDADAYIESLEQLLEKKRQLKQGAMQELLRPGEGWEEIQLDKLVIEGGLIRGPFGGALKKEFFVGDGIKVYEQKNAIYMSVDLGNYFIDHIKYQELKRFEVFENDFILSCSGTIGKLFRIPKTFKKGIINQALLIIRLDKEKIDLDYFSYVFQYDTIQAKIIDDTQGGAMKNLVGMSEFKKTKIPIPSTLAEQTHIATILSDMDAELAAVGEELEKARQMKQGMMQELLTGKIRLV